LNETLTTRPIVSLDHLIDQTPDGGQVVELYQSVRIVRDVEAANENVKGSRFLLFRLPIVLSSFSR
jgi:hypothetical protein